MVEVSGEEIREQHSRRGREFLGKTDQKLREKLLRTDGKGGRNGGRIRQVGCNLLQDRETDGYFHLLFGGEEERDGSNALVPEHGETMPQAGLDLIRQTLQQQRTAASQAEAHLLGQEIVPARIG